MSNFLTLPLDELPFVIEALRAYAPDAAVEQHDWFARVLEARRRARVLAATCSQFS